MYAIFKAKGKQFRAEPDATLRIPSLDAQPGDEVTFDEVLLGGDDGEIAVGRPSLDGASVRAEVVRHGKDDKVVVYKMKRRKGYRRKYGHRQPFTEIRIVGIDLGSGSTEAPPATEAETPEPEVETPEPEAGKGEPAAEPEAEADVEITDAARALAGEHGLDLSTIEGTGVGGRILKGDVQKAIKAQEAEE